MSRPTFFAFCVFLFATHVEFSVAQTPPSVATPPTKAFHVLAPVGQIPDWLQEGLKTKVGIPVFVDTYTDPNEVPVRLAQPGAKFDLLLVPDRAIAPLIAAQALRPLPDASNPDVTHFGVEHYYLSHYFDIDNTYVIPYGWSVVALACTDPKIKTLPTHFGEISPHEMGLLPSLDVDTRDALEAKIALWSEKRHTPQIALKDVATVDPTKTLPSYLVGTYAELKKIAPTGSKFFLPEEGSIITLYHLALPKSGENSTLADGAISFLLDPAITARWDSELSQSVTQKAARDLLVPEIAQDTVLYPPLPIMSHCSFVRRK